MREDILYILNVFNILTLKFKLTALGLGAICIAHVAHLLSMSLL